MDTLNIALLQLLPGLTPEENLSIGLQACETAKAMGADIALFPEMWSTGYGIPRMTGNLWLWQPRRTELSSVPLVPWLPDWRWLWASPFWSAMTPCPEILCDSLTGLVVRC